MQLSLPLSSLDSSCWSFSLFGCSTPTSNIRSFPLNSSDNGEGKTPSNISSEVPIRLTENLKIQRTGGCWILLRHAVLQYAGPVASTVLFAICASKRTNFAWGICKSDPH